MMISFGGIWVDTVQMKNGLVPVERGACWPRLWTALVGIFREIPHACREHPTLFELEDSGSREAPAGVLHPQDDCPCGGDRPGISNVDRAESLEGDLCRCDTRIKLLRWKRDHAGGVTRW